MKPTVRIQRWSMGEIEERCGTVDNCQVGLLEPIQGEWDPKYERVSALNFQGTEHKPLQNIGENLPWTPKENTQ